MWQGLVVWCIGTGFGVGVGMADYYSIVAKAVRALDLNTEMARRRLYERARDALRSKMHSAYPPFHRSEIATAEMSLETAIEAVEAVEAAVRERRSSFASPVASVSPSPPANQNGEVRHSLATLLADIFRRADDGAPGRAMSDHREDGTDCATPTSLTELLARASRGVDNDEQDFTRRWTPTQNGEAKRQRR
jgi:hypothetical protein